MTERNTIYFAPARSQRANRKGIVLILTMAILVILTTIVYSVSSRVSIYKRRQEYIINYQSARYACDSAMKYALTRAIKLEMPLITREDSPDFSDLFALNHEQYMEMLTTWAEEQNQKMIDHAEAEGAEYPENNAAPDQNNNLENGNNGDPNETEDESGDLLNLIASLTGGLGNELKLVDVNELTIPGPYGPEWPLVYEPIEFEIGNSKVEILFKDENAKFPLALALTNDLKLTRQASDAVEVFCEWMQMDIEEIETLALQLEYITSYKEFSLKMRPIVITEKIAPVVQPKTSSRSIQSRRSRASASAAKTKRTTRPAAGHVSDFAKLLHSSMVTTSRMEKTLPEMGERQESPMKYLGIWGVDKVNINTAPRQVLEAVFAFGGDQGLIAEEIITQRQIKPYENVEDLKEMHYGYTDSIDKVKSYLTTKSTFITVEIRAVCGNAKASSVSLIEKKGSTITKIGMVSI